MANVPLRTLAALLVPWICAAAGANEFEALIDRARGVPGEFAADVMIRIAALDKLEKGRRIQLLEEAFLRASEAPEAYKRHPAVLRMDLPGGFQNRAYNQDLDAMSLRVRAVAAMLPLDSRKARDLFTQIPPPNLAPLRCEDLLVYDVSRLYATAANVARQAFSAKEAQQGEPFRLLSQYAGAVTSPAEVEPAARMIAQAGLKEEEFLSLVTAFSGALGRIAGDDRSFTASLGAAGHQIQALVEECQRRQVSPLALVERYRLYLVNHLSAARCESESAMQNPGMAAFNLKTAQPVDTETPDAVAFFNDRIRVAPLATIQDTEAAPSKVEGTIADLHPCEDAACRAIQQQLQDLQNGPNGLFTQSANRSTPEWQEKLREFLTAVANWKANTDGLAAQHFRDKSGLFSLVFNLAPPGRAREMVLDALLEYLRQSRLQVENRAQWFLPAHTLIALTGLDPLGSSRMAEKLRAVNDPIISLYAALEALAPHTIETAGPIL